MKKLPPLILAAIIAVIACSDKTPPDTPGSLKTQEMIAAINATASGHYLFDKISIRIKSTTGISLNSKVWANPNDTKSLMERIADTVQHHPVPGHTINFGSGGVQVGTIVFQGNRPTLSNTYSIAKQAWSKKQQAAIDAKKSKAETAAYRRRLIVPNEIEDFFLNEMKWDTQVESYGVNHTTIRIKYILMGRVLANELSKSALADRCRNEGYLRLVLSDGYDFEVVYRL